jgi:type II secretory pathway pseudopilin PulG
VSRGDRLYRAIPLATAFLWLCVLYGWQTRGHVTPWLFTDELKLAQISRSISETGHPAQRGHPSSFQTLYAYVLAPFWRIGDVATAYAAIKYAGVVVMTSAMFPAYFLARMIVSRPWALFAAVGAVATPALAYAPFLIEEPAAYPWATLTLLLIVKALATGTRWWVLGAAAATIVAPFVRGQLAVLIPVYVLAALFLLWTSAPAKRWRRTWSRWDWAGAIVLLIGGIILSSAVIGSQSKTWFIATGFYRERTIEYGLWAAGAFAIGLGLLPIVALAALARPRGEQWTRELKAFVAVTAAGVIAFGLYTATKAAYLSTVFSTVVAERNLIYLAPLAFVATALALERPRLRWWAVAATAGFVLYVILTTPYQLNLRPYSDALGLSIVQMANVDLAFDDHDVTWLLVVALIVSLALLIAPRFIRGSRFALAISVAAAGLVLSWNLAGEISASNGTNGFSQTLLANFPSPPNWLDKATGQESTIYLGQRIPQTPNGIWLMEFWNRSLRYVWSLDGTAPGPGTTPPGFVTPDAGPDGRLTGRSIPTGAPPGVNYIVADQGIDVAGTFLVQPTIRRVFTKDPFGFPIHEEVVEPAHWRLLRIDQPLRLRSTPTGVEPDGWMTASSDSSPNVAAVSAYNQFSTPRNRQGFIQITVSRGAWKYKPGSITITAGRLIRGSDKQPAMGLVTTVLHRVVPNDGKTRIFYVPASPPTRVEVRISPTFSPADYGGSDRRRLGAQISYAFTSKRPPGT